GGDLLHALGQALGGVQATKQRARERFIGALQPRMCTHELLIERAAPEDERIARHSELDQRTVEDASVGSGTGRVRVLEVNFEQLDRTLRERANQQVGRGEREVVARWQVFIFGSPATPGGAL